VTTLAEISTRWSMKRLADVFQTQLGKMLSEKSRTGFNPKPYLRNANVQWERADVSNVYVMDFTEEEQRRFSVESGDLLMCEGGEIGRTCLWRGELSECYFQKAIHRLRPRSTDVVPEFYLYWMEWAFRFANLYGVTGTQTTIAHLPQEKLAELRVPVPSTSEQRAIAHAVQTVQKAREARQRELTLERESKAALMEYLFTKGTRGERVKRTEIGDTPESWNVLPMSKIAKIERGKFAHRPRNDPAYYGGTIPFVQTGDVTASDGYVTKYSQTLNEKGLSVSRVFPKGTVLITIAANIGFSAILEFDSAFPDSLIGITPNERVEAEFLNYYLMTQQPEMDRRAPRGTQKNINIEFLAPWQVPVPSLDEQRRIATVLHTCDRKIQSLRKETSLLTELFDAMLQNLMTGRVSASAFAGQTQ